MKFKTIFALFNAILIFSFSFIFFMPFLLLGAEYSMPFWAKNWPLFLFFTAVLIGFNAFFISNWRLFTLLESEDWDALGALLEARVFGKKHYDRRTIRLLVNTALLRGDMGAVEKLEATLSKEKPAALRRDAVLFGAARLLKNETQASVLFLEEFADGKGVENPAWITFYHAFALVLVKRAPEAVARLEALLGSRDTVLASLSAYLLGALCAPAVQPEERDRLVALAEAKRVELFNRFGAIKWAREVERAKNEIHVVILSRILDEASAWLLGTAPAA